MKNPISKLKECVTKREFIILKQTINAKKEITTSEQLVTSDVRVINFFKDCSIKQNGNDVNLTIVEKE